MQLGDYSDTVCALRVLNHLSETNLGFNSDSDVLLQFYPKYDVLGEFILSGLPTPQTLF